MKNILVCDDDIKDDESIYSIIETDEEKESSEEELDLIDELAGIKIEMMDQINSKHKWDHKKDDSNIKCVFCIYYQDPAKRATCRLCLRQACMSCLKQQSDMKKNSEAKIIYEENKVQSEKEVILEEKRNKYLNNIPQEFLIPRLSFKTEQTLLYFTRDIIDLI